MPFVRPEQRSAEGVVLEVETPGVPAVRVLAGGDDVADLLRADVGPSVVEVKGVEHVIEVDVAVGVH